MRSNKYEKLSAIMKKMERQEKQLLNKIERRWNYAKKRMLYMQTTIRLEQR